MAMILNLLKIISQQMERLSPYKREDEVQEIDDGTKTRQFKLQKQVL